MNPSKALRFVAPLVLLGVLSACVSGPQVEGSWQSIGESSEGNIRNYIDKSSIKRTGNLVSFRDKKTVVNQSQERYVNTPRYKTAIGTWEIDCARKTYRLSALTLLDKDGKELLKQNYTSVNVRPMAVAASGSIVEKQYQTVCAGK
ncbi:MAG: hypothetical protein Q4A84_09430 [Neisseria sp.]|uniref:surface-adhesin E family protein n=1 Tax=Neisseria sp. TaxID=192066 RepID=UPI0026DCB754|nr:surface-adhesin E family protein [Neisseria sp.]MDO4641899.1 hypothetical protein [Neisseria sp.]